MQPNIEQAMEVGGVESKEQNNMMKWSRRKEAVRVKYGWSCALERC